MADRREEILARISAVLEATAPSGSKVLRNAVDYTASQCPIFALLDGDEQAHEDAEAFGKGRSPWAPTLMAMRPEVWLLVQGSPASIGPALNGLRAQVLAALSNDATLIGLVHNKDIRYEGCTTALGAGRTLTGEMSLHLRFVYTHRMQV